MLKAFLFARGNTHFEITSTLYCNTRHYYDLRECSSTNSCACLLQRILNPFRAQAAARYLHLTQSYERVVTELKPLSKRQELMRRAMNNDSASADDSAARNAAIDAAAQQELRDAAVAAASAAAKAGAARGPPMDASSPPFSSGAAFDDDVDSFRMASPAFVDVTAWPVPAPPQPPAPAPNANSWQAAPQQQQQQHVASPDFGASTSGSQASQFGQRTAVPGGGRGAAPAGASAAYSSAAAPYNGGEVVAWTPVVMGGCAGTNAASVNGVYVPTGDLYNGKPLYQKQGDPGKWLRFVASNARWSVGTREDKDLQNANGWCESIEAHASLPTQVQQWQVYSDCSWGLQPSCSCVAPGVDAVATLQAELAAAREQLLAAQQMQSQTHNTRYEAQQQQQVARDQVSALEAAAKAQRLQQVQQQQQFQQQQQQFQAQQQHQRSVRDMPPPAAAAAAPRADFTWQDPPIPPPAGSSGGYRNVQAVNGGGAPSSSSSAFGGTGAAAAAASEMRGGSGGSVHSYMHGNIGGGGVRPSSSSAFDGMARALAPLMGKQWVSSYNNELFDVSADGNLCKNGKPTDPLTLVGGDGASSPSLAFGSWRLSDTANHQNDDDVIVWRNPGHSLDPITWRTLESVMLQPLVGKRWISSFKAESFDVASSGTLRKNGRPATESIRVTTGEPLYGSHGGLGSRHAPPILMTFGAWSADLAASSTDEIQWRNPGDPMDPIIWRAAAVAEATPPPPGQGMMNANGAAGGIGAKNNNFWSSPQQQQPFSDHQAPPQGGVPGESILRSAFISFRGMDGAR